MPARELCQGVLAGLEDIGVIDPYGPTLAASEVLAGLMAADARYSLRRMDPKDLGAGAGISSSG